MTEKILIKSMLWHAWLAWRGKNGVGGFCYNKNKKIKQKSMKHFVTLENPKWAKWVKSCGFMS